MLNKEVVYLPPKVKWARASLQQKNVLFGHALALGLVRGLLSANHKILAETGRVLMGGQKRNRP